VSDVGGSGAQRKPGSVSSPSQSVEVAVAKKTFATAPTSAGRCAALGRAATEAPITSARAAIDGLFMSDRAVARRRSGARNRGRVRRPLSGDESRGRERVPGTRTRSRRANASPTSERAPDERTRPAAHCAEFGATPSSMAEISRAEQPISRVSIGISSRTRVPAAPSRHPDAPSIPGLLPTGCTTRRARRPHRGVRARWRRGRRRGARG